MREMGRKIGIGVVWNLASFLVTRGATTLFTLFLAWLLAPEAFGLVAMSMVVFELASAFAESGLGQALIRSKQVTDADLNTVFYSNLGLGVIAYTVLFLCAPLMADFYSQPKLVLLIQVTGLVVIVNAVTVVQTAVYSRKMNFRALMKANTIGVVIAGGLAIAAAYLGWGVWSLVVQILASALVSTVFLWLASHWRPRLEFSTESFLRLFAFGRNLLLEGIVSKLYQSSYILVIGRLFSAELTGLYFFARKVTNLLSRQLTAAVQQATYPALATLQDQNNTLRYNYRRIMQLLVFLTAPVMLIFAGLVSPLFNLVFDHRWHAAVPYIQILCVVGALYPIHALNINLLKVKGRSDLILKIGFLKKGIGLTLLFLAIPYGVLGVTVSQLIASTIALIPNAYFSSKLVGYSFTDQMSDAIKPISAAAITGFVAWHIGNTATVHSVWLLFTSGLVSIILYLAICLVLRTEGEIFIIEKCKWLVFGIRSRKVI